MTTVIKNWLAHHPEDHPTTLAGVELVIREQATNWNAHKIKLTIIWSPENKLDGHSAEKHTWSASNSRTQCENELSQLVLATYKK